VDPLSSELLVHRAWAWLRRSRLIFYVLLSIGATVAISAATSAYDAYRAHQRASAITHIAVGMDRASVSSRLGSPTDTLTVRDAGGRIAFATAFLTQGYQLNEPRTFSCSTYDKFSSTYGWTGRVVCFDRDGAVTERFVKAESSQY
jgi:hypothetical protein